MTPFLSRRFLPALAVILLGGGGRTAAGQSAPGAQAIDASVHANATVSPDTVVFGDTVQYIVAVEWSGDYLVAEAVPPDKQEGFLVVSSSVPESANPSENGGKGLWRQTFELRAIQEGTIDIPPFTIKYRSGKGGAEQTLQTPTRSIHVNPPNAAAAKGKLEPLTPPLSIPFDWTLRNLIFAGVGLVSLALLLLLGRMVYRRAAAHRFAALRNVPQRPPHDVALEQLDELARSTYLRDGRFKLFFTRLSEILRRYIQFRYSCPALDWTSYEILDALTRGDDPPVAERDRLARIFDTADLAKFSQWTPSPEAGLDALESARAFVEATRPVVQEAAA